MSAPRSETVDVEEDDMGAGTAWAVAHSESCSFSALAVFVRRSDALRFAESAPMPRGAYRDLVVLPATAFVRVANTYDTKAGRAALKEGGK